MISLIFIFLLGGFLAEAMSVTGQVGNEITVKCSHTFAFSNVKYFCKASCRDEDVLIRSGEADHISHSKRYEIRDKGNIFYVTITDLGKNDTGTYWCAVKRTGFDSYKKVHLTVTDGTDGYIHESDDEMPQSNSSKPFLPHTSSSAVKPVYIGAGLAVVVLALALVFLTYFRVKRKKNTSTSSEKHRDVVYATPSRQDAHHDIIASSSPTHETQEARSEWAVHRQGTSRDLTNGLVYSTVTFDTDTECSVATRHPGSVVYSTIKV
ncbi:CMRF35-like molecule 9 [Genypterus blacodes]|uniref:CMRF35-like molecule 9 n=1 Tax=Genypterus blacodes TaxID=154954 RepID=UPI003F762306